MLDEMNISRDLQQYYKRSGWIKTIGAGAFIMPQDKIDWMGGIYPIQNHLKLAIHPGGLTAISLQGYGHYIRSEQERIDIFIDKKQLLPKWFKQYDWCER